MFTNKEEKKVEAEITSSSNTIGKGTFVHGDIETHGNLRIEGKVEGNIKTKSKIVLGKSSIVVGNITAQNAEVEGHVTGKVHVGEILILKSSSKINGDIKTNRLIVESGSEFNGGCKMGATKERTLDQHQNQQPADHKKQSIKETQKARTV